jgi:hypothetical protein
MDVLRDLVVPWRQSPEPFASAQSLEAADHPMVTVVMPSLDRAVIEKAPPATRKAFRNFENGWSRGQGTRRDFYRLVRLLHRTGCSSEAEYFLRSNLLFSKDDGLSLSVDDAGLDLYEELFGTARQEEFAAAIAAFAVQFAAPLTRGAGGGFLVGYQTVPRAGCLTKYRMRNKRCAVHFEYGHRDYIEAEFWSLKSEDQLLFLRWVKGVWEIIGTGCCTVVREE